MKIAVIFGSRTTEHDVSIISGLEVFSELQKNKKYQPLPVYIRADGTWEIGGNLADIEAHKQKKAKGKPVSLIFNNNKTLLLQERGFFGKKHAIDLVFPVMHGLNGEDGTLQGVLEMAQVPYTCSGVLSSALGMDKVVMKEILEKYQIPLVKYEYFIREEWEQDPESILKNLEKNLKFPIFVKPANLGSSIGISKATNLDELKKAIEIASYYDDKILCEEGIENLQEINCSVYGTPTENFPSLLEEPLSYQEFLTFEEKYINDGGSMQGVKSKVKIPAPINNPQTEKKITQTAQKTFQILHCFGTARIDFLVNKKNNQFYVNEINMIPGSLQKHLWEKSGLKFADLLKKLIQIALKRARDLEKNSFSFNSNILIAGNSKK